MGNPLKLCPLIFFFNCNFNLYPYSLILVLIPVLTQIRVLACTPPYPSITSLVLATLTDGKST